MTDHTSLRDEYAGQAGAAMTSAVTESDRRQADTASLLASSDGGDVLSGGTGDGHLVWPSAAR